MLKYIEKMTRASKRKSDHQTSASVKSARVDSVRSGIVWAAQFFFFLFLFFFNSKFFSLFGIVFHRFLLH